MRFLLAILFFVSASCWAQQPETQATDSLSEQLFERGSTAVNQCTPWHHVQCVFITTSEVYQDGKDGKPTRHWWRMSYIGRACSAQYGKTFGKVFEGVFAVPHYLGVGLGNGVGYVVYLVRGPKEKQPEEI